MTLWQTARRERDRAHDGRARPRRAPASDAQSPASAPSADHCVGALGAVVVEVARGWRGHALVHLEPRRVPSAVFDALLFVAREAAENAYRHGGRHTTVLVRLDGDRLVIRDDGPGFNPMARRPGFGIVAMRGAAREAGLTLRVCSWPGDGTTVEVAGLPRRQERNQSTTAFSPSRNGVGST